MIYTDQPAQFVSVIQSNKGIIYKVANSYCNHSEDRKDLIQEIIIQLWLSFSRYDEKFALTTWIYRIALNVSISFYRKETSRSAISQSLPEDLLYFDSTQNQEEKDSDLEQLHLFIKELKEIDKAIMILYLEGKNQQETAEILGLTPTNVSTKISRIKQQLKQKFTSLKS